MTASCSTVEDARDAIGEIVQLLHQASEQTSQGAATEFSRIALGHAIYLLHAQLSTLLPDNYSDPRGDAADRTVVQLLLEAERRSWTLPLHRPEMAPISSLAITLCDLIREAKHHGR